MTEDGSRPKPDEGRDHASDHGPHAHAHFVAPPIDATLSPGARRLGLIALALLAAAMALGGVREALRRYETAKAAEQFRTLTPRVNAAQVRASSQAIKVTLTGATEAFAAADIYARANGYIESRYVDIGQHVKAGEILAQLSAPELEHQVAQAQATLAQSQAALAQSNANSRLAEATNARSAVLVKKGWVTAQQGDTDRLGLEAQKAAVNAAQANIDAQRNAYDALKQQRDYLRVTAPFDGVVTQRRVDTGSLVQSGATLMFTLMQNTVIRVQVNVPQDQAFGLTPGLDAKIRVPEMPDRDFTGKVSRIAEALQQGTRTLLAEIDVPNPDGALEPGAYCAVELNIPRKTPALLVPAEAIIFNRDGVQTAVVENGVAHLRKIDVARDFGTQVEARSGVKAGDMVILNPNVDLVDGAPVEIAPPPAAAAAKAP